MATGEVNIQKFCLEHMVKDACSNAGCTFSHYERQRVQVINVKSEEGYVEGRLSLIPLCRFYPRGLCRFGNKCRYRHEIAVTMPNSSGSSIPSTSSTYNNNYSLEKSREKTCGICFEVILEKTENERKFGILPNCCHCYCIACICKWRQSTQFERRIIKACPECRVTSDFVCPSQFWVETKEDKDKLIMSYKQSLASKDCKHFRKGKGKCPFGNKCFYKHALPNGRILDVGPPRRPPRHRYGNITSEEINFLQRFIVWNMIDDNDDELMDDDDDLWQLAEAFDDFVPFFTDDEDSELSDYDYLLG